MKIYDLNKDNLMLLAAKHYDSPHCIMSEFEEDFKRVKYIKRLISRYHNTGDLKERLILNHIIILGNVFGADFTSRLLFYQLDEAHYEVIKTFLIYLGYISQDHIIMTINGQPFDTTPIHIDGISAKLLRAI